MDEGGEALDDKENAPPSSDASLRAPFRLGPPTREPFSARAPSLAPAAPGPAALRSVGRRWARSPAELRRD